MLLQTQYPFALQEENTMMQNGNIFIMMIILFVLLIVIALVVSYMIKKDENKNQEKIDQ